MAVCRKACGHQLFGDSVRAAKRFRTSRNPISRFLTACPLENPASITAFGREMRSFLRVFFVFWIASAALVAIALALAALKAVALVASASLYNAMAPFIPGGQAFASLAWGIALGVVVLPVFASCIVIVIGIMRMLKGWPFRAR